MDRVAVIAPAGRTREALKEVARSAAVELALPYTPGDGPDELDRAAEAAVEHSGVSGLVGWAPSRRVPELQEALKPLGAGVVPLKAPRGVQPPTLLTGNEGRTRRAPKLSRLLVDTYTTVPYADVDPARLAGLAYVVMFGMMFGDAGQGLLLVIAGLLVRSGRIAGIRRFQRTWLFIFGAGLAAVFFGVLYGEFFGPTQVLPVIWLEPVENPIPLLIAALIFGAVLLALAFTVGTINRVREGGWGYALYARTGLAGAMLFLAVGLLAGGLVAGWVPMVAAAAVLAVLALVLIFIGLFVEAGGGGTGTMQASVELVDTVIQLASNLVSFTRLAAFGLTHAALMSIVWQGTTALWHPDWRAVLAIAVFLAGNAITFALEGLVAAIQALRLEYYELFSRIFTDEGRPFKPWSPQLPETAASGPSTTERQTP
ncbi:ATPase [Arthrobacter gandavensis]|uniref:V-type ATPase 116kDa subunit family protein n=1 Tax=Arthrobacter gandavensis TaxID=169960 RepID=UPI00188FD5D0|nr:V-type ATPase 116kDa subunit family protein [Arthrobacter gandavensis]MBF4994963.1 ATPase [Arthrobacter gandavensis]